MTKTRAKIYLLATLVATMTVSAQPSSGAAASGDALRWLDQVSTQDNNADLDILPVDMALPVFLSPNDAGDLIASWDVQPGYYLYKDKIALRTVSNSSEQSGFDVPAGEMFDDPEFGKVEIFRQPVTIRFRLPNANGNEQSVSLHYQGCADAGLCFPPQRLVIRYSQIDDDLLALDYGMPELDLAEPAQAEPTATFALPSPWPTLAAQPEHVVNSLALWRQIIAQQASTANDDKTPLTVQLYADWCAPCKQFAKQVDQQPELNPLLERANWVVVDVSDLDQASALLNEFNIAGPPAWIFFDQNATELRHLRITGASSNSLLVPRLEIDR